MLPYSVLAGFYDTIIKDDSYDKWTSYIVDLVQKYSTSKTGLDVACGSGIVTLKLKKAGFNVTGIDISNEMLLKAQASAIKEGLNVTFLRQDMKSLRVFEKVGFITAINDGLNYVKQNELKKVFSSFNKCLIKGGTIIFDVSSSYKLKNMEIKSWSAMAVPGGMEIRMDAEAQITENEKVEVCYIDKVEYDEESIIDTSSLPSLVLLRFGEGDKLWDIAKENCSCVDAIMEVNEMEKAEERIGKLILIPKTN